MEGAILREDVFSPTGGTFRATDDGVVTLTFGGQRASDEAVVAEAHWCDNHVIRLKEAYPNRNWKAIVDLARIPDDHRPPHAASEIYTHFLRDESLSKVALVHATNVQRAVVTILLAPAFFADKVHYFANAAAARNWIQTDHPRAGVVNW